jgi:microcystin-dependent protein
MCCGNGNNPVGTVNYFARQFPPEGWLLSDGREVSRDVFADLFNMLGTSFGTGDGKTTFNLPDLRAEFIRGLDMGRGIDDGRQFGSSQNDTYKSHYHNQRGWTGQALSNSSSINSNTAPLLTNGDSGVLSSNENGKNTSNNASRMIPIASSGDSETRPRNVALLACIKY